MKQLECRFYSLDELSQEIRRVRNKHFAENAKNDLTKWGYEWEWLNRRGVLITKQPETPQARLAEIMNRKFRLDSWTAIVWTSENESQEGALWGELEDLRGSFMCVPQFGVAMEIAVGFEDETGRHYRYKSDKIGVTGYSFIEPKVTIQLNKDSVAVGEAVTVDYEIAGSRSYENISWGSVIWATENESQGPVEWGELEELKGGFTCKPKFGVAMRVAIDFDDETGRHYHYQSDKISITGYSIAEPQVTISLNKNAVAIGDTVVAEYEITGPVAYHNLVWDTVAWTSENESQGPTEWGELEKLKGNFICIPRFGVAMAVSIGFEDDTGRYYHYRSNKTPIDGYASGYDIYSIIEGQDTQISTGKNSLTFRSDGDFEKYLGVQVDGKAVPSKYVKAWSGSTYVELSAEYLASLPDGEHELIIVFEDGVAVTKFATTKKVPELPQTGDTSNITLYMMLTAFSTICLMTMVKKRILK